MAGDVAGQAEQQSKLQQRSLRAAISRRLGLGHLVAVVAVVTTAHAASYDLSKALPLHALVLLICTASLRTVLAFSAHSVRTPAQQSGMVLALSAAVQFSSNSLHLLAAIMSPMQLSSLVGYAAVDVSASWLQMTVHANTEKQHPFAIFSSLIYTAADIFLAAVIAKKQTFISTFYPFLPVRLLANARLLVVCSKAIVQIDRRENETNQTTRVTR